MKNNKTKNVAPPTKTNTRLRNFMMRYYFTDNKNPDTVYVEKLSVKAYNTEDALDTYNPISTRMWNKNLLNWTAKRIS